MMSGCDMTASHTTATPPPTDDRPTAQQRSDMRRAIAAQCFGAHTEVAFDNGIILLYLNALGMSDAQIVLYIAMRWISQATLQIPAAYLADRFGKKRMGLIGAVLTAAGFVVLAGVPLAADSARDALVATGVLLGGGGTALFSSGWFALLSAIVPATMRGRFFGRLRFSWMSTAIVFAGVAMWILSADSPLWQFQIVMGLIALGAFIRVFVYGPLTEMEEPDARGEPFWRSLGHILQGAHFMPFLAYSFVLFLFTAAGPALFALIEKRAMHLSESMIVGLGATLMMGSLIGFALSGRVIDRLGTKPVFLVCHFGYAGALIVMLMRDLAPVPGVWIALAANVGFGICFAASSVALSTELLAVIPPRNKSLSTSLWTMLMRGGKALSGGLVSAALGLGVLAERWQWFGQTMTAYDTLLLMLAALVTLMIVTLGLVPSVIGKAGWVPQ